MPFLVEKLIRKGAIVDATDDKNHSIINVFLYYKQKNRVVVAKLLINASSHLHKFVSASNVNEFTALLIVSKHYPHNAIVDHLIKGAAVNPFDGSIHLLL